jgi:hypothetical protein
VETCANCGTKLTDAEPASVWQDSVVCVRCKEALERQSSGTLPVIPMGVDRSVSAWHRKISPVWIIVGVLGVLVVAGWIVKPADKSAPTVDSSVAANRGRDILEAMQQGGTVRMVDYTRKRVYIDVNYWNGLDAGQKRTLADRVGEAMGGSFEIRDGRSESLLLSR